MKNFLHIAVFSVLLSISLALALVSAETKGGYVPDCVAVQSPIEECVIESQTDCYDTNLNFSSGRSTTSVQRTVNARNGSRRNYTLKIYNPAVIGDKTSGCCSVSAYFHNAGIMPLASDCGSVLIVKLHQFLI